MIDALSNAINDLPRESCCHSHPLLFDF
jgi:hypothetical protein